MKSKKDDAIWGAGCFDNMQAQMLASEVIWSSTKTWEIIADVLAKKTRRLHTVKERWQRRQ